MHMSFFFTFLAFQFLMDHEFKPKHPRDVVRHRLLGLQMRPCGYVIRNKWGNVIPKYVPIMSTLRKIHSGLFSKYKILTMVHKKWAFFNSYKLQRKNGSFFDGPKIILNMCNIWHFIFLQNIYVILFVHKFS
jgi:hypothetical protein